MSTENNDTRGKCAAHKFRARHTAGRKGTPSTWTKDCRQGLRQKNDPPRPSPAAESPDALSSVPGISLCFPSLAFCCHLVGFLPPKQTEQVARCRLASSCFLTGLLHGIFSSVNFDISSFKCVYSAVQSCGIRPCPTVLAVQQVQLLKGTARSRNLH